VYSHLELTISEAESTVTIMSTSLDLIRIVDSFKPTFEKLKKRGVKVRIAAPLTPECEAAVKDLASVAEVRHTEKLVGRFTLVDASEIVFMVMDDAAVHPTYDVGIWVNTPFFTKALEDLFELAWKQMKPAKEVLKLKA
jgi:hypothetical protein